MRTILFLLAFSPALLAQPLASEFLVLGPFPFENAENMQAAFDEEILLSEQAGAVKEGQELVHEDKTYQWRRISAIDSYFDLDAFFNQPDFAYAYAYAEIEVAEAGKRLIGAGSNDAIKIWLNGDLIHANYILRGHQTKQDVVEAHFKAGKNTLLVKVLDAEFDWGFSLHYLTAGDYPEMLVRAAGAGQLDMAQLLLNHRANVNIAGDMGLTPWQTARIKGRGEMCELLEKNGAKTDIPFPSPQTQANQIFQFFSDKKYPGAAVLVAQNGKILYQKGFGYADVEKNIPVSVDTKFRIGSISKQFTAVAILKLAEQGQLSLDDKLSKFIPDFPRGDEVMIHHLLAHTSGIFSYTSDAAFISRVTSPIKPADLVQEIKAYEYDFDPGTNWMYNNSGYFILGYLVEQVSGMSFDAYLKKTFFKPLGMKNTGVYKNGKKLKNEALGYVFEDGKANVSLDWDMSWAGGAGNLYSTVGDLLLWNEGIFNGKVLSEKSIQSAHSPVRLNNGELPSTLGMGGYGYGWAFNEFRGAKEIAHSGGLHGFVTNLTYLPQFQGMTVAVLTNSMPMVAKGPVEYTRDLVELFAWQDLADQGSFSVQKEIDFALYDDYLGQYEYSGGAIMEITREGDRLFAKLATQNKLELFPLGESKFFWKAVDAQIEFVRDESGAVTHGIHTQGGQTLKAPRILEVDVAIDIDPAILDRYVGEYALGPATISVFTKGTQLFVQVTGQEAFPVFPKSETEFFLKVVKASIAFESDADGNVTHLVLDQGGMKQNAIKK